VTPASSSSLDSASDWDASDDALVDAVLEGNDRAFRPLVRRYEPVVASTVIGLLGPGPQADDVGRR
jgi:RNA polymerase sigma-70 factor (ECF subfamily)